MEKLYGVVPPMITPFKETGEIDVDGLKVLIDFLSEHVDGLFVTGSYGSGPLMSLEERKTVVERSIEFAAGNVPIIVMVGSTATRDAVDLARHAEAHGASSIAAVGPYYYTHTRENLVRFFGELVRATRLPVYVYNNPKFQGYDIELSTISSLAEEGVRGVKDATFDISTHADYHRHLAPSGFDVVLGTEAMWLPARALGCEAFIPGLGNAFPEICRKMHREGMAEDYGVCRGTQKVVNELREIMYLAGSSQPGVYAMLELRGILNAYPRSPFTAAGEQEKSEIREALRRLSML